MCVCVFYHLRYLLVSNDYNDFISIVLDRDFCCEPSFQCFDWPSNLICSRSCFNQQYFSSFNNQLPIKTAKSNNVGMNVVNQTHFK